MKANLKGEIQTILSPQPDAIIEELDGAAICSCSHCCQRRLNFPQKCRSKIPHLLGPGDQPASVISGSIPCLWRPSTA
ncbi:hypothetical protein, partial [Leisingera sp. JC11]|uniref:hypothetical protein n=1 Tax=Leisingera sp. JC11 TaxID=3042469 RepID=UPI0034560418